MPQAISKKYTGLFFIIPVVIMYNMLEKFKAFKAYTSLESILELLVLYFVQRNIMQSLIIDININFEFFESYILVSKNKCVIYGMS